MAISKKDHQQLTRMLVLSSTPITEHEVDEIYRMFQEFCLYTLYKFSNCVPEPYLTALKAIRAREGDRTTNILSDAERAVWIDLMISTTVLTQIEAEEAIDGIVSESDPHPVEMTLCLLQVVFYAFGHSGHPLISRYRMNIEKSERHREKIMRMRDRRKQG